MPIKINLLAEEQVAEELRRKDPLKRAIVIAAGVVALVIIYAGMSIVRTKGVASEAERAEKAYDDIKGKEFELKDLRALAGKYERNLSLLHRLTTNRFLLAPVLNELQYCMLDGVRLTQFQMVQTYSYVEAIKAREDIGQKAVPPKSIEHKLFRMEAQDTEEKFNEFMAKISQRFEGQLRKREGVSLQSRSDPIVKGGEKPFRAIVIECRYPDITREP